MIEKLEVTFDRERFIQRYLNTYGWLINEKGKSLVKVANVSVDKIDFKDVVGNDFFVYTRSGVQFEFLPVNKGFYVGTDKEIYYMERKAARQYQRGISVANTNIYNVSQGWLARGVTAATLINIFESKEPFSFVPDKPCALSKTFAIDKNLHVTCFTASIGDASGRDIKLKSGLFYQEMLDVIRRNGYNCNLTYDQAN